MRAFLLFLLVACGKGDVGFTMEPESGNLTRGAEKVEKTEKTGKTEKGDKPGEGGTTDYMTNPDAVSKSTPIHGDPTMAVVERAFRNQRPAFPLLSKTGTTAVVDLKTRIPPSSAITYAVDFVDHNSTKSQPIPLVNEKLLQILISAMDTAAIPMTEVRTIVKAARRIHDRIDEEEFTRFEGQVEKSIDATAVAAGVFKVRRTDTDGTLVVEVSHDKWNTEAKLAPETMPKAGAIECTARPVLRRVFFDNARRRVLVHLGWEPSADQCTVPDDRYHLVGPST